MPSRGNKTPDVVVRFAPSPNGMLHLGHAYAAMCAHDFARDRGGRFLLRIEDIDGERSRTEYVEAILADLHWLGLDWDEEPIFQSNRLDSYAQALDRLRDLDLIYPCFCTRSQLRATQQAMPVPEGPDGPAYPGTCKGLGPSERERRIRSEAHSWRLDVAAAMARTGRLTWTDIERGEQHADAQIFGDVILDRKTASASYHLAATLDDDRDGITHVVRGMDLFQSTHIHRLLQALLNLQTPQYWHHPLLLDDQGRKLAKRRKSDALADLRANGIDGKIVLDDLRKAKFPLGITLGAPR